MGTGFEAQDMLTEGIAAGCDADFPRGIFVDREGLRYDFFAGKEVVFDVVRRVGVQLGNASANDFRL